MTAAILAGGRSSRMGKDKALLDFKGKPLICWVYEALAEVFDDIFVVGPAHIAEILPVESYNDMLKEAGNSSLRGIYTGLVASPTPYTFFVPCDTPFLSPNVLRYMKNNVPLGYDAFVPQEGDFWQPLHAVYSKTCLSVIEKQIKENDYKIFNFFDKIKVCSLDSKYLESLSPNRPLFFNINTKEDLVKAEKYI